VKKVHLILDKAVVGPLPTSPLWFRSPQRSGPLSSRPSRSPTSESEPFMERDPIHCLTCHERARYRRGCCPRCIGRHRKAVAAGKATWTELLQFGLVLPARPLGSAWRRAVVGLLGALVLTGCARKTPGVGGGAAPAPAAPAVEVEAPNGKAIADPVLRESREQADAILNSLLAGKFDQDPALLPVARKLKGFQSWTINSQKLVRADAAEFRGTLTSPTVRAGFDMTLVKQANGKWAVATFSGPNRLPGN
jgi:hypothetical protein